jgi:hypothetical protein
MNGDLLFNSEFRIGTLPVLVTVIYFKEKINLCDTMPTGEDLLFISEN